MPIEFMAGAFPRALPQAAPKACPASKSILRHCWQRPPGEVRPKRLFKHRAKRHPHRRSASVKRAARYVYGSVDMPAEQVMNWVGNAKTVEAAQQILGQGGIPNTALVKGGKVSSFRLEHVWVEAFVSYFPSRGAKHIGGQSQGDTWVPLDASFKQYQYSAGMDLATIAPFDASTFLTQAQQGATLNEAEGWVQNFNHLVRRNP